MTQLGLVLSLVIAAAGRSILDCISLLPKPYGTMTKIAIIVLAAILILTY